jgi:dihydroorotate dehydrogenase (fumarate)
MIDLKTSYLGLDLKNPLLASSSPLTGNIDSVRALEDEGASAIILPSLFEETLINEQEQMARFLDHQEIGHHESDSFLPVPAEYSSHLDKMLDLVDQCKKSLDIPIIGSINGVSPGGWLESAQDLQQAGCHAIELNLYSIEADIQKTAKEVEEGFLDIIDILNKKITIPISVKLSPQFSSLTHFVAELEQRGTSGVVCFNRFYQPDIELETLTLSSALNLSSSYESLARVRWIALLKNQVKLSLAATGGFHNHEDVLKGLLAGADAISLCSVLMKSGPQILSEIISNLTNWMEQKEYDSVEQLKGSLSYKHAESPSVYARGNYVHLLDSYTPPRGVKV